MPESTAREWLAEGQLVERPGKVPRGKLYLAPKPSVRRSATSGPISGRLQGSDDEFAGYKTQKPINSV